MAYILEAPSLSKLAPGEMYYSAGQWVKDKNVADVFKTKKEAQEVATYENETTSAVTGVKVVALDGFKEDAIDGDGDGIVQEGTEFERPVEETKPVVKKATRKPRTRKAK